MIALAAGIAFYMFMQPRAAEVSAVATFAPAKGANLYAKHCAACHGADLQGQANWRSRKPDGRLPAPPHDETGHTWHHPDPVLFAITKFGTEAMSTPGYKSDMPGFGDLLDDPEIHAILDYIKSRWPDEIRRRQATITARQTR